jgi:hypothetical protein
VRPEWLAPWPTKRREQKQRKIPQRAQNHDSNAGKESWNYSSSSDWIGHLRQSALGRCGFSRISEFVLPDTIAVNGFESSFPQQPSRKNKLDRR